MNWLFYTSALGWLATLLLATGTLLPYLLRRTVLSEWLGTARGTRPYLQRMWAHYWAGYLLFPMALAHAWIPMRAGNARGANFAGLWIGTISLMLLFLQTVLGLSLKSQGLTGRSRIRQVHWWIMLAVALTAGVHIWLNS